MDDVSLETEESPIEEKSGDLELLEDFVFNNELLEKLEALTDDFNPFVALRWTRQEVRHSAFVRWLLDPAETHGLGAYFLKLFAQTAARKAVSNGSTPSVLEIDSWSLTDAQVQAEWNNIDVLVHSESNRFVAVIENKVDSCEHSNQLQRYHTLVNERFRDYKKLYIYLTVDGEESSHDDFVEISYSEVVALLDAVIARRQDQLGPDVYRFIQHYIEMLRRHIVEDSEVQRLCKQIYSTHRRALDLIFEHRPDTTLEISELIRSLIRADNELIPDHSSKSYVRMIPARLDFIPKEGTGWTKSGRLLLFEFDISPSGLRFKVVLGPGDSAIRDIVNAHVASTDKIFNRAKTKMYPSFWSLHTIVMISKKRIDNMESEELLETVKKEYDRIRKNVVPKMVEGLELLRGSF